MAGRLSGKVCIITGTGGSMGRETALSFAREDALPDPEVRKMVTWRDTSVMFARTTCRVWTSRGRVRLSPLSPCKFPRKLRVPRRSADEDR